MACEYKCNFHDYDWISIENTAKKLIVTKVVNARQLGVIKIDDSGYMFLRNK